SHDLRQRRSVLLRVVPAAQGRRGPRAPVHRRRHQHPPAAARRSRAEESAGAGYGGPMNAPVTRHAMRRGFTLLEVLIALAIVAMAVGALLGTITSSASSVSYLRTKTIAEWVALNRLTEIRISQQMPDTGRRTGKTVMAGMRWQWEQEVVELPIKGMFRIDVRARNTGETVD